MPIPSPLRLRGTPGQFAILIRGLDRQRRAKHTRAERETIPFKLAGPASHRHFLEGGPDLYEQAGADREVHIKIIAPKETSTAECEVVVELETDGVHSRLFTYVNPPEEWAPFEERWQMLVAEMKARGMLDVVL